MGADVYATLAQWHRPTELLDNTGLLVFPRAGSADATAPKPDGAALPEPWRSRVMANASGNLVDDTGRTVVRYLPIRVSDVAASTILRNWDLVSVPETARPLLAAYWSQSGTPTPG
jgi:nicotinic acid mononucleotide adenylyltransferase